MRLTCPNCDAQYEVPDDVIPVSGRDVQCSNCSDTWFQPHPDHPLPEDTGAAPAQQRPEGWYDDPAEDGDEANAPEEDVPIPDAAFNPHAEPDLQPAAKPTLPGDKPKSEPDDDDADDNTLENAQQRQTNLPERIGRREIDPAVASVLRAEAEREQRARAAAQSGLETQPELGLSDEANESRRARAARLRRMARTQSEAAEPAANDGVEDIDVAPAAHRSLYPAIEEINAAPAQLAGPQAAISDPAPAAGAPARQRSAFRSGVLVALLIAVTLLLIYSFATQLADMLPPLSGALSDYTAWVDGLRQWLDHQIAALMLSLDDMAAPAPSGDTSGG